MGEQKGKIVIGLDFGGGNITAYASILNNGGDPTPIKVLENEQETSVYTILKDGRKFWGDSVLCMTAEDLTEAVCFKANFKALPGTGNDREMTEFARMIFETIRDKTNGFYGQEPVWVIGCPSSWPVADRGVKKKYAALFQKAGMEKVIICEESTAAVSYYDKALKVVTRDNTAKGVLLIDWGSSTLDATFILPPEDGMMKRVETSGCALGAHFIDRAIIHTILYRQEDYGLGQLNSGELTQKVREKYENDEAFCRLLDCHARVLKEAYFRSMALPGLKPKRTQLRWKDTVNLSEEDSEWGEGDTFYTLGVSIRMMEDILSAPVREVVADFDSYNEFTRNDIGNDSFIRRNERFLEELHDKYEDYARAEDALIMLTGGASQMDFIRKSVGSYFPNHKIDYDNHPELSIGKGLAYYGREALQKPGWEEMLEEEAWEDAGEEGNGEAESGIMLPEKSEEKTGLGSGIILPEEGNVRNELEQRLIKVLKEELREKKAEESIIERLKAELREELENEIKERLKEEVKIEICQAFRKAFGETFSDVFSQAFSEVYDDEFDDEKFEDEFCEAFDDQFCEALGEALELDNEGVQGADASYHIKFSEFTKEFDRITNVSTDFELRQSYEVFLNDVMEGMQFKLGRAACFYTEVEKIIDALDEWKEEEFIILQERAFTNSVNNINVYYEPLLCRYGIFHPLFDECQEKNWMPLPDEVFHSVAKREKEASDHSVYRINNRLKGYSESKRGRSERRRYVTSQCEKMRERLEEKKQDILSELRQMAEANYIKKRI